MTPSSMPTEVSCAQLPDVAAINRGSRLALLDDGTVEALAGAYDFGGNETDDWLSADYYLCFSRRHHVWYHIPGEAYPVFRWVH